MEQKSLSEYQKKMIQGLKTLASKLEEMDPEELDIRIKKTEHLAPQYAVLERSIMEKVMSSYFTDAQQKEMLEVNYRNFRLAVKKLSPDVYYQALDLMYEASKAKKKISECTNCGRVIIGECERCVSQNN
jgi:hypothetical protein